MGEIDDILHKMAQVANEALQAYRAKDGQRYERIMHIIELLEEELHNWKKK